MDQETNKKFFDIKKHNYSKSVKDDILQLSRLVSEREEASFEAESKQEKPIIAEKQSRGLLSFLKKEEQKMLIRDTDEEQKEKEVLEKKFKEFGVAEVSKKKAKPKKVLTKKKKIHRKIMAWSTTVIVLSFITISLAGAAYADKFIYENKVFPGVTVWGIDAGGKTMSEVQGLITKKINNSVITIKGPDQTYQAKAEDLGIVFNSETMALSAYSKGRTSSYFGNYITRIKLLFNKVSFVNDQIITKSSDLQVQPSYEIDNDAVNTFVQGIVDNINITARDSEVSVSNGVVTLIPAVYGREVVVSKLSADVLSAIKNFGQTQITVATKQVEPAVIDNSAEETILETQKIMNKKILLAYNGKIYSPDKETISSWISYSKKVDETKYTLVIDTAKMVNYFSFLQSEIDIATVNKKIRVENGDKQTVIQEGKSGLAVNTEVLGKNIADKLSIQESVRLEIPTYVVDPKVVYEYVTVANWDKYIDVNISTQTMTAYLKGGEAVGSWKITTGNLYHSTPVGTWLVTGKTAVTRMTGGTPGVDYYDLPNVHWVTWFKGGGYSIHEAYWRTTFGSMDYKWNGSHGCVNATYDVAKFIYDWAPVGTPVIVHY